MCVKKNLFSTFSKIANRVNLFKWCAPRRWVAVFKVSRPEGYNAFSERNYYSTKWYFGDSLASRKLFRGNNFIWQPAMVTKYTLRRCSRCRGQRSGGNSSGYSVQNEEGVSRVVVPGTMVLMRFRIFWWKLWKYTFG